MWKNQNDAARSRINLDLAEVIMTILLIFAALISTCAGEVLIKICLVNPGFM